MSRVLVIDDEKGILEIVSVVLSSKGFKVHTSSDALNINEIISTFKPDLVLLDLLLGSHSGLDTCKEIKEISADLPIIIFSADSRQSSAHVECGANDFIAKPFDINDLVNRVNMLLKHRVEV